jgi:hypothetical protein
MHPYPLIINDGGRNRSRRPYQINDCTVRSLAIISNHPYDQVYDLLKKAGRKSHKGFDIDHWLGVSPAVLPELHIRMTKVNKRGLTVNNFSMRHPKGRFLLENRNHIWAVWDGTHHDLIRVKDQPLCSVWRVE